MIPFKSLVSDSNLALVPVAYVELGRRNFKRLIGTTGESNMGDRWNHYPWLQGCDESPGQSIGLRLSESPV